MVDQELLNDLINDRIPYLKMEDKFKFQCRQCGRCCHNIDILMNTWDVIRLTKHFNMSSMDFIDKYCEIFPGGQSKLPILRLVFRPVLPALSSMAPCPFQKGGKCGVYAARPNVCRGYPIGRASSKNMDTGKQEEKYFVVPGDCAGFDTETEHVLKDWVAEADLETSWAMSRMSDEMHMAMSGELNMEEIVNKDPKLWVMFANMMYNTSVTRDMMVKEGVGNPDDDEQLLFTIKTMLLKLVEVVKDKYPNTDKKAKKRRK